MVNVINPSVEVVDYYPKILDQKSGQVIVTPDELIYGAGSIAFKDIGFLDDLLQSRVDDAGQRLDERAYQRTVTTGINNSAGRGHASLATSAGLCVKLGGDCSKFVDAYFTPVKYGSSVMASGRRVPIAEDQIVVPKGIRDAGDAAVNLYVANSQRNIRLYEQLQKEGVKKEEAAKIVQYGHRGGGFTVIPIETVIALERTLDENNDLVPVEMREIHNQIRDFIFSHGMQRIYTTRKNAPRVGCPNPNIFHNRVNSIQEFIDSNYDGILYHPVTLKTGNIPSEELEKRIHDYQKARQEAFSSQQGVRDNWRRILKMAEELASDFGLNNSITIGKNVPLRVWGEDKRHRVVPQQAESVYHALERAGVVNRSAIPYLENFDSAHLESLERSFASVLSLPRSVTSNPGVFERWLVAFSESITTYEQLKRMGIKPSDAVHVVPRGLKIGVLEELDLYNMTTGKMSLRLCKSCEPEMRETTEQIRDLILESDLPNSIKTLLGPKCLHTGFCHEPKHCERVLPVSPFYNAEFHKQMLASLTEQNLLELGLLDEE